MREKICMNSGWKFHLEDESIKKINTVDTGDGWTSWKKSGEQGVTTKAGYDDSV